VFLGPRTGQSEGLSETAFRRASSEVLVCLSGAFAGNGGEGMRG